MQVFDVSYYREGRWWVIEIPGVGAVTQAADRAKIRETARECIALYLDTHLNDVAVRIRQRGGPTL